MFVSAAASSGKTPANGHYEFFETSGPATGPRGKQGIRLHDKHNNEIKGFVSRLGQDDSTASSNLCVVSLFQTKVYPALWQVLSDAIAEKDRKKRR